MKPFESCQTRDRAYVPLIDIEDDDDVIIIDSPDCAYPNKGESSEQRENRRVSPQSVISIEDDDENESYTNHISAHEEEGFTEFESDATSSHRSHFPNVIPRGARSGCYRFGDEEYEYESETVEIDSDSEVMEDSSGMLREQWEKAASKKKVSRHKASFGPESKETAPGSNTCAFRQKNMTAFSFNGPSCSEPNAPCYSGVEIPSTCGGANEENYVPHDQDTLFPEFDWRNLGGSSSFKKTIPSDMVEDFQERSNKIFNDFLSENLLPEHTVGGTLYGIFGKDPKEQCCADATVTEGTSLENFISVSQSLHKTNINQAQCSADNERNASLSSGKSAAECVECDCVFPSACVCGSGMNFSVEKVHKEKQIPSLTPCKSKSNHRDAAFDKESGDTSNIPPVDMDWEADCDKQGSIETDEKFEKLSSDETVVRQNNLPQSKGPVEGDTNDTEASKSGTVAAEVNVGIDIINDKEKLKETEEYKCAMEEEWALRQQQLKLQAEEAQRLRKRKKAESLRVSNMEKRQKQRLEEVRESQKQDSANLNMKEQFRTEVIKELKLLEMRSYDMASLLRCLGVKVEGGSHPSPQQIHSAYRVAVLKFHPDRTSGSSLRQQVEAEEKFKLISRMKEKYNFR